MEAYHNPQHNLQSFGQSFEFEDSASSWGELIHATQIGFVKERSILDNIFTFWEATTLARLLGEDFVILLLDFEKAYDRVDWSFLERTMLRLGFEATWIRGVASSLYSTAQSQ